MTAPEILETLTGLGVTVKLIGPDRLRLEPAERIPDELKPRILKAKAQIVAALRPWPTPAKAVACRYDWIPGYRGSRLRCTIHGHANGGDTVFRTSWGGYDTLAEMLRLGALTGEALTDAGRVN
jgi:hypothetical protein